MTRISSLPEELPARIEDLPELTAPLIIDSYLSRDSIVDLIVNYTADDIVAFEMAVGDRFRFDDLCKIAAQVCDTDKDAQALRDHCDKHDIIRLIGDDVGFDVGPNQDQMRKGQLIHLLLTVATDADYQPFRLPNSPDPSPSGRFEKAAPAGGD